MYNGHKIKHAVKFQVVITSDEMLLHDDRLSVARQHNCRTYEKSGLDPKLEDVLMVDGKQFCLFGDSE